MDAITLLKNDHKTVEDLFRRFEQAGDRAYVEKRRLVDRMIEELSRHAAVEEQLFYPATRATVPDTEDIALESIEEHHIVKWELQELKDMDPQDERFDAKVSVLMENVRHHVEEEESDYFPKVRDELGRNELQDLGDAMERVRTVAPTRPHPRLPQTPPFNLVAGLMAGAADMVGDTVRGVAQGSVSVVRSAVGLVPGIGGAAPSPVGSTRTRAQAIDVRDAADEAADVAVAAGRGAKRTAETAARGATTTAGTATAGAKGAATSARKGADTTRSTAKRAATSTGRAARKGASSTRSAAKSGARSTKAAARS
ncbi:MAG: hemerythrin domain-containing protein [Actinomycetota bacterium]|nr:hemerythrin domain-containing protein [Actinomycetota bacterium]